MKLKRFLLLVFFISLLQVSYAFAHEAWLLTPQEMIELSTEPLPGAFRGGDVISVALALLVAGGFLIALTAEYFYKPIERRLDLFTEPYAKRFAPLIIRITLAMFMIYAAMGWTPRHGVQAGTSPTLFVPDMELNLLPAGFEIFSWLQIIFGLSILFGFFTRAAAFGTIYLCFSGLALFGERFVPYFGHAFAPALYLLCVGGGVYYVKIYMPAPLDSLRLFFARIDRVFVYRALVFLTGINFAFLGFRYKFLEPNLLIKILEVGQVPNFGIPYEYMAVMMAYIETTAGVLIALGLLVRPLALFLIGAMMFLAISLGETFMFHSNIFGLMFIFALFGDGSRFKPDLKRFRADEAAPRLSPVRKSAEKQKHG